jgi:hypothetical protein
MNRPDFERTMADLRSRIATLPAAERPALEALAAETERRHHAITRDSLRAHAACERLELHFEQLGEALRRLDRAAREARAGLARMRRPPLPPPSLS